MKDTEPVAAGTLEGQTSAVTSFDNSSIEAVRKTGALSGSSSSASSEPVYALVDPREKRRSVIRMGVIGACSLLLIAGGIFVLFNRNSHASEVQSGNFATVTVPLTKINATADGINDASSLKVNGQLDVANTLVLTPSSQPAKPTEGQLFYDKTTSRLTYYDGKEFLFLQGGGNTFVTNNIAGNSTTVNNITNVIGGGVNAVGGTAGTIAMFTSANTLGNSTITQSGGNLIVGASTGSGASFLQGGTGGINLLTGDQTGASGSITVMSGASTTTSSGDIRIDTGSGVVNGTQIKQLTFESGTEGAVPYVGIGMMTATQDCTVSRSGSCSMNITGSDPLSGGNLVLVQQQTTAGFAVVPGHRYFFTMYSKAATTPATITAETWGFGPTNSCIPNTVVDNVTSWTQTSWTCVAPAGSTTAGFTFGFVAAVDQTHYFDDLTVIDMSSSTSSSSIKIGDTNAQDITIGNSNEIGLTSIQGGSGININSGLGTLGLSGGSFNLSSSAASSITTAKGGLNITSGDTSSWTVSESNTGNGGNLTLQAGSGSPSGDFNGGNLVLQAGFASGAGTGGNVTVKSLNNTGATGSISISTGNSSTTASGDINIDTGAGVVTGVLVGQKTFESGTDNMYPWFGTTLSASTEQAHTGSQSLKMTKTGNFWGILENNGFPGTPVVPGHQYYISAWIRAATTPDTFTLVVLWHNGVVSSNQLNAVTDNTTGWTEMTGTVTAPAGADMIYLQSSGTSGSAGEVHYWDDVTITDLSSGSAASSINLGTTNAKYVSIGNINQMGPTTITGGGINLNAGVSNLNMTAGVFNLTGSAASVLSTSAGALTITSGTSATWGIAAASSGAGGDLTLKAGDSADGSDGGNLVLQGGVGTGAGIGGSVIVRPREDSSTAFLIQNSSGNTPLFTADTANMIISITGTTTAFAKLALTNAHFAVSQTNAPTIGSPLNCGAGSATGITAGSADAAGSFTITTGTDSTATTCDTVITFNKAYAIVPKSIIVIGKTDASSAQRQIYVSAVSTTSFTVSFGTSAAGANGTLYSFTYWVVE